MQVSSLNQQKAKSAAERWELWKSKAQSPRRRNMTRTEQRRAAQRASVVARRRNSAEAQRRDRNRVLKAREERKTLEEFGVRLIEERIVTSFSLHSVFLSEQMSILLRAVLGRELDWVRATPSCRERATDNPLPVKTQWDTDPDHLVVAISVDRVEFDSDCPTSTPYRHSGWVYWLKRHDLLSHADKTSRFKSPYLPAGVIPWQEVVARGHIHVLRGLPTPPVRRLVHGVMARWEKFVRDQELPWDGYFLAPVDEADTQRPDSTIP